MFCCKHEYVLFTYSTVTFDWADLNGLFALEKKGVHSVARQAVQEGISCCNDATHFHKNRYFGVCLLLQSFFLSRFCAFVSLPPSLALSPSQSSL